MTIIKRCKRCGLTKEFYGHSSSCKSCCVDKVRQWRAADPARTKAARQAEYKKGAARQRAESLRKLYGLGDGAYEEMLRKQNSVCAICLAAPSRGDKFRLAVDHNHADGSVRGLLCARCNVGLGGFRDAPELLRAAARYLERQ